MKFLRSILMLMLSMTTALMIVQTAAAAPGKGGEGSGAAVKIDIIVVIDTPPQGGEMMLEISGGGFLGGAVLEVTLDGLGLAVDPGASQDMLVATIPALLATDGPHEVVVTTGGNNKESDSATITLGGEMFVSCISWFVSGPADEHVHTEVHVEDENGNAVIGASVMWEAENPSGDVYQTNASVTHPNDGHAKELTTCPREVSGSGVTDWFCCIGAGAFDSDGPPGKRACEEGTYTARIISVGAPLFTNMVWDEMNECPEGASDLGCNELEASTELVDPKFP
jgi:hypothetical protein